MTALYLWFPNPRAPLNEGQYIQRNKVPIIAKISEW
jgi:hypothetical protein